MVHLVYFAVENLSEPTLETEAGANALVACLQSLLQNCLLLDFADYRVRTSLRKEVGVLVPHVRKRVEALLTLLAKRNRLVPAAETDSSGTGELQLLAEQAQKLALEIVIIRDRDAWDESSSGVPRTSVAAYALTDFEARRSQELGVRHLRDAEVSGEEFIERFLVPFLRYSRSLHIIDGVLGRYYFNNKDYRHTLQRVLAAIAAHCRFRDSCDEFAVTIHCRRGEGKTPNNIQREVKDAAHREGIDRFVQVCFHDYDFKHDRCLASEIGGISIGRGFDFFQWNTGLLNDTDIGFGNQDAEAILEPWHCRPHSLDESVDAGE